MTTEEIIKGLESVKAECGKHLDEGFAWICKPIDEAIEVLKREPCDDCISRQAVLDVATTIQTDDFSGNEIMEVVEVDDVKALPPVTPQPKTECSCEQIKWERDTAIAQLKELGYGLGEKPKTDVLDKIRAEIEEKCCITVGRENDPAITLYDVFQIIDKYKESEGKNDIQTIP